MVPQLICGGLLPNGVGVHFSVHAKCLELVGREILSGFVHFALHQEEQVLASNDPHHKAFGIHNWEGIMLVGLQGLVRGMARGDGGFQNWLKKRQTDRQTKKE